MKIKNLALILFVLSMVSCHKSKPFVIDGKETKDLFTGCGRITVMGLTLFHEHIFAELDGDFTITPSDMKIQLIPDDVEIANLTFFHNDVEISNLTKAIEIKGNSKISIRFDYKSDTNFDRNSVLILLLPSNFIMCEDQPIITDTIKIKLK